MRFKIVDETQSSASGIPGVGQYFRHKGCHRIFRRLKEKGERDCNLTIQSKVSGAFPVVDIETGETHWTRLNPENTKQEMEILEPLDKSLFHPCLFRLDCIKNIRN